MSGDRRLLALQNKLALLRLETAAWRAECAGAASRFALHASQIEAVCADLDAMHDRIASDVSARPAGLDAAQVRQQEKRILAVLQIWDTYRAKWALRVEPRMAETLNLLDDLAWLAYRPALDAALKSGTLPPDRARLPPLVFPSPRWSPFARPREQGYELDDATGNWSLVDDFDDLLRCMPVPLIGIPWTQAAHLAEAVFVGHETGHLVEEDLELQEPLRVAVAAALAGAGAAPARVEAWSQHWRSEVFADLWGLLCCGPAYARMLTDVLVDAAQGQANDSDGTRPDAQGRWGTYPPRPLRLQVLAEGLRHIALPAPSEFEACARGIEQQLASLPSLTPSLLPFAGDVPRVVATLLGTPLAAFGSPGEPGRALRSVLGFSAVQQAQVQREAQRALKRQAVTASDVRVLFAAIAWAFHDDPATFHAQQAQALFEARLSATRTQGVRSAAHASARSPAEAAKYQATRSNQAAKAVFEWADRTRP